MITVVNNTAPVTTEIFNNITVLEYYDYSLTLDSTKFTDVDNDTLTFSLATNASWITTYDSNLTFEGTPNDTHVGNHSLSVTATDISGASVTISGYVEVVENSLPRPIASATIPEPVPIQLLHSFSFNFSEYFEEPDGEDFSIEKVAPANYSSLTADNTTKIFGGVETTNVGADENITFTFRLTDLKRPDYYETQIQFTGIYDKPPYLSGSLVDRT